ncbi:MAG: hypothetical protein QME68_03040, partial [Elusimicrobiota bacterium]|nr:hypothetical protein [Elusimicrobiota bacterium]
KETILIEVKDSQEIQIPRSFIYFMEKQKLKKGIVIYNGEFRKEKFNGKQVVLCPVWYFLLIT